MCASSPLRLSRSIQLCDAAAAQRGVKLLMGFDFHEYVSITQDTPTKGQTFPNFRPDRSTINAGEGYWLVGVDKNESVVFTNATRLYHLPATNFAEHLQSLRAFYTDPVAHAGPQDYCTCLAPSGKKMTGKVAYNGDLWVRRDVRGQGLPRMIARITHSVSFAMWAPDFLCALVARWRLAKGLPHYRHHEPGGSILRLVKEDIEEDNWLVWVTGEELRNDLNHCYMIRN
ncbi:hypothetical protein ABIC08_009223 [Bradyrhizobium sp. RT9b]